jgi:PleD family two-component response regulator
MLKERRAMKRILIVDDNEENLYLLHALLQGHGYEVEQARNGSEALAPPSRFSLKVPMIINCHISIRNDFFYGV